MQKILLLLILLFLGSLLLISRQTPSTKSKLKNFEINGYKIIAEIADTDEKKAKGLSHKDKLGQNEGMLFVFDNRGYYRFWMKDMKFPLDFVWINDDKVVDLTEDVRPATSATELKTFTAKYPFDKVLEVNSGTIKSLNIIIGDSIILD